MSVRLGALAPRAQQAQLDGFKSRALRLEATTRRHAYVTEWRALDAAAASARVMIVVGDGRGEAAGCVDLAAASAGDGEWAVQAAAAAS